MIYKRFFNDGFKCLYFILSKNNMVDTSFYYLKWFLAVNTALDLDETASS